MKPFLKWPGGKRWAAPRIAAYANKYLQGTYYEPFLGGGSVFFEFCPIKAILSDLNSELITTYQQVKSRPSEVTHVLKGMKVSGREYLRVRDSHPACAVDVAARLLYLNRTGFAGMYRLNKNGEFNVPYGGGERTPAILWEKDLVKQATSALKNAELVCSDFEPILERAKAGDVVYCDPTYTVAHDDNCFIRYNDAVFAWDDQKRLARAAFRAAERGATVIVSNAHHKSIRELYSTHPVVATHVLRRTSCVARLPEHRREVEEYMFIIRNGKERH